MGLRITKKAIIIQCDRNNGVVGTGMGGITGSSVNKRTRKPEKVDKVVKELLEKKHLRQVMRKISMAVPFANC